MSGTSGLAGELAVSHVAVGPGLGLGLSLSQPSMAERNVKAVIKKKSRAISNLAVSTLMSGMNEPDS